MLGRLLSHDLAAFSVHSFAESATTFSSQLAWPSHLEYDSFSLPGQATLVVFRTHSPAMAETLRHNNNRQQTRDFIVCDLPKTGLNRDFLLISKTRRIVHPVCSTLVANSRICHRFGRTDVNDSGLGLPHPSFVIVNGYYAETWLIWAIVGVLLLTIGVVIVWRAASCASPGTELGEGVRIGNPLPQSRPRAQKDIPSPLFKWKDLTMGESRLCQKTAAGHHSRRATGGS
jgi:hypothetical protein